MAAGEPSEEYVPAVVVEPAAPQRLSFWTLTQSYGAVPFVMNRISDAALPAVSGPAVVAPVVTSTLRHHW